MSTLLSLFSSCALRADPGLTFLPSQAWGPRPPGTHQNPEGQNQPQTGWSPLSPRARASFIALASEGKVLFSLFLSLFFLCVTKLLSQRFEEKKNKLTAMEILILEKCQESKHGFQ